jgi:uncharacterized membrane protein
VYEGWGSGLGSVRHALPAALGRGEQTNGAQVHLALHHLPIFATSFGFLFRLIALLKKNRELKRAGLWLCVAAALGAVPTYLSGEPAEEVVESMAGIEEAAIEEHEEMALLALAAIEILGAGALAGLYLSRKTGEPPERLIQACLILSLAALAMVGWTARLGGEIHHPETRPGYTSSERPIVRQRLMNSTTAVSA